MKRERTLLAQPQWTLAAQALVNGCADLRDDDDRVAMLENLCTDLGDSLYPAFLRILALVGRFGDYPARAAVAQALVAGLQTGRLPAGRQSAWGGNGFDPLGVGLCHSRSLGPIEYLCVWYAQGPGSHVERAPMAASGFSQATTAVLELIDAAPDARQLYGEFLLSATNGQLEGALARGTRQALTALADAWINGASGGEASAKFLAALPQQAPSSLGAMASAGLRA